MKYKVLLAPIQITHDTQAQEGDIVELSEADGTQLMRWGIVKLAKESPPPKAPSSPPPKTTESDTAPTAK